MWTLSNSGQLRLVGDIRPYRQERSLRGFAIRMGIEDASVNERGSWIGDLLGVRSSFSALLAGRFVKESSWRGIPIRSCRRQRRTMDESTALSCMR